MLEVLTGLTVLVAAVLIIVLVLASRQPRRFAVARSAEIAAAPERVHTLINDLREMNRWNPYVLRDPKGTPAYSGPAAGPGAKFDFAGSKSGTGSITILNSTPDRITMRLLMSRPFSVDNKVEFTLESHGDATRVTWGMSGPQSFIGRVMSLVFDGDKMCGRDFEEGLANLRSIAEARESEVS